MNIELVNTIELVDKDIFAVTLKYDTQGIPYPDDITYYLYKCDKSDVFKKALKYDGKEMLVDIKSIIKGYIVCGVTDCDDNIYEEYTCDRCTIGILGKVLYGIKSFNELHKLKLLVNIRDNTKE